MNHEYYTGEKSVTVTVGKRDIVISPADAFTNRNTEPEFETEVGGMGLAGADELKNVQYKIEEGADLGVPGEYSVEIASYLYIFLMVLLWSIFADLYLSNLDGRFFFFAPVFFRFRPDELFQICPDSFMLCQCVSSAHIHTSR